MIDSLRAMKLTKAAFGSDPGAWPLPSATGPQQRWLRAVAAAGQGYYAVAQAELAAVRRAASADAPAGLVSLAHSTQASLLRQLGWHDLARGWDGRALLLAGPDDHEARLDALVGLAADALGVGRFAVSERLLTAARREADNTGESSARQPIRLQWVSAELAMAVGDGSAAVEHARNAVRLAADGESARHQVKSEVVLAAALCCAGQLDQAHTLATELLDSTERLGLIPLRWAVASLLDQPAVRDAAAALIDRRGGCLRGG